MAQNQDKLNLQQSKLCIKCTEMYGHPNFEDMCSACFKKQKAQQKLLQQSNLPKPPEQQQKNKTEINGKVQIEQNQKKRAAPAQSKEQKIVGKCAICQRKTKMLGYACKHCNKQFCRIHRLPEDHQCEVDFVTLGKKKIKTQNPNISHKKIDQF